MFEMSSEKAQQKIKSYCEIAEARIRAVKEDLKLF